MTPKKVVEFALSKAGAPYVWGGKGLQVFTSRGLAAHPWQPVEVYDCSGLVTSAIRAAGGPDLRGSHSAQVMFDTFGELNPEAFGALRFYGSGPNGVTHVAIGLGHGLVVEAAGGDSRTVTPADANRRGARVRVGFEVRADFVGARCLPF